MQSLLNKVCPENLATIVAQIAAVQAWMWQWGRRRVGSSSPDGFIQVEGQEQLEAIIELIFRKAVTEPHYCLSADPIDQLLFSNLQPPLLPFQTLRFRLNVDP